jgi:hypothetical protein
MIQHIVGYEAGQYLLVTVLVQGSVDQLCALQAPRTLMHRDLVVAIYLRSCLGVNSAFSDNNVLADRPTTARSFSPFEYTNCVKHLLLSQRINSNGATRTQSYHCDASRNHIRNSVRERSGLNARK